GKVVLAEHVPPRLAVVVRLVHAALWMARRARHPEIDRAAVIRRRIDVSGPAQTARRQQLGPRPAAVPAAVEPTGRCELVARSASGDGAVERSVVAQLEPVYVAVPGA